ncbi:MAG TPA: hypothetical protein PKD31_28790, partial [Blastocatellia bacterium]|nr:hypothetical protein [Blastocatellia bacterium]
MKTSILRNKLFVAAAVAVIVITGWAMLSGKLNRSRRIKAPVESAQKTGASNADALAKAVETFSKPRRRGFKAELEEREKELREDEPGEAMEFFLQKRLPEGETSFAATRYLEAIEQSKDMPVFASAANRFLDDHEKQLRRLQPESLPSWTPLGPGNVGGRTRALLIHPTNANTMYAAGVAGGVWKTTDGGATWLPLTDLLSNIAVSSLAMEPGNPNVIYAGTGEGFSNIDAVRGAGIFKTTDGGASWTQLATTANNANFYYVSDIVLSPLNTQRVYAATSRGVFRSVDGGGSWT